MKRNKMRATALLLALALLLAGCGSGAETVTLLREWEAAGSREKPAGAAADFRIGMVTEVGGIDDASFNQSAWEGLQELSALTGCTVDYVVTNREGDFYENFSAMAESGYHLIWGIGYASADAILAAAERYPDVHFAVVDSSFAETPDNVAGVVFHAEEASFLAGYIAASASGTGKLGFVGGIQSELIDTFQYGYQAGSAYADRITGKHTDVSVSYAGSWGDPDKGRELAEEMFDAGCDIIYHAAGGTGVGVIECARDRNKFAIGVDRDQAYLAPKHVLTSALKKVNAAVLQVSRDFVEGREIGGQTFRFGLAEGAVGIPDGHSNYSDEIYDAALRVEDDIISGAIVPPDSAESYQRFMESFS